MRDFSGWPSRSNDFVDALGWPGIATVIFLVVATAANILLLTPLATELSSLKNAVLHAQKNSTLQKTRIFTSNQNVLPPAAQLASFYQFFPLPDTLTDGIEKISHAAMAQDIVWERGDYQLTAVSNSNLLRYRIALPLKGSYPYIRKFVADVLTALPHAALESIVFQRKQINDPLLDVQLTLSLYVRKT